MGPCDRYEGGVCTEKGEDISIVKGRERRGTRIHTRAIEERIYLTLKVASNGASVLHRKERW